MKPVASIAISKKGGHVIYASLNRDVKESKISHEEANKNCNKTPASLYYNG